MMESRTPVLKPSFSPRKSGIKVEGISNLNLAASHFSVATIFGRMNLPLEAFLSGEDSNLGVTHGF
jgi:hypothetical protein